MSRARKTSHLNSRGAVSLEFVLVGFTVIYLALVIVDMSRYVWTKSILLKATQSAARSAASISGFESNTYVLDPLATDKATVEAFEAFYKAKTEAEKAAYSYSKMVVSNSKAFLDYKANSASNFLAEVTLLPYRSPINFSGVSEPNRITDVAIIRPGEGFEQADPDSGFGTGIFTYHNSLCPNTAGCRTNCMQADTTTPCFYLGQNIRGNIPYPKEDMTTIYKYHPIIVEMRARINTITPWIFGKELIVKARSFSYREIAPVGTEPGNNTGGDPKSSPCDTSGFSCDPATQVVDPATCSCVGICDPSTLICGANEIRDIDTCSCVPRACSPNCGSSNPTPCAGVDFSTCSNPNFLTCTCNPSPPVTPTCQRSSQSCFPRFLVFDYINGKCVCSDNSS